MIFSVWIFAFVIVVISGAGAQLNAGLFDIRSVFLGTTLQTDHTARSAVFALGQDSNVDAFSTFKLTKADQGGFVLRNVGLNANITSDGNSQGSAVRANSPGVKGKTFAIQSAGRGMYIIKLLNADLLWTLSISGDRYVVVLMPSNGIDEQHFFFETITGAAPTENAASRKVKRGPTEWKRRPCFSSDGTRSSCVSQYKLKKSG